VGGTRVVGLEMCLVLRRHSPGLGLLSHDVGKWNTTKEGFGKGFGLSLCAVPLTQQVPHLGLNG
jgi:hypothetical protein